MGRREGARYGMESDNQLAKLATDASSSARAWSTAARIAPRSTGPPLTPVGTTSGLAGQILPTSAATRLASGTPPAGPASPPSTTQPGSSTTGDAANPV